MKKVLILGACVALLASCGQQSAEYKKLKAENDSLRIENTKNTEELNDMLSTLNDIEADIQSIRDAENYLTIEQQTGGELSLSRQEKIKQNMQLISETLKKNRAQISELEEKLENEGWGYVSNRSGGFLGFWWHFLKWRGCNVYWQIEQGNLCLKLGEVYENQGAIRDEWMGIVFRHAQESGHAEIERPRRRPGTYMTTAIVPRQAWLGADEELIDTEAVVERLKKYEAFLDECLK